MNSNKNIYIIYSSLDIAVLHHLLFHLKPLEDTTNIVLWHDDPVLPKQPWQPQDDAIIGSADMFILLASNTFMHSPFIQQLAFKTVIDRYKDGKATVIPVLLDDCPWDTEFNSDDYDFSFKELQVLPKNRKPISKWSSEDEAIDHIVEHLKKAIAPTSVVPKPQKLEEPTILAIAKEDSENDTVKSNSEQKKVDEPKVNSTDENKTILKEATRELSEESKAIVSKEERVASDLVEKAKAKRATEERKIMTAAADKKKAEEDRLLEEAKVKQKLAETKKVREIAETDRRIAEETVKRQEESLRAKKLAQQEKERIEQEEVNRKVQEEQKRREAAHAKIWEDDKNEAVDQNSMQAEFAEDTSETNSKLKNWVLIGIAAVLAIIGIWFFSDSDTGSKRPIDTSKPVEVSEIQEANTAKDSEKPEEANVQVAPSSNALRIGNTFEGGYVFELDASGNSGKIAYNKDAGPVTWKQAQKGAAALGEGWRLPTLAELRTIYRTIGPGKTNSGNFTDDLYWSGTPFDEDQARLLRLEDGNSSFHYNSRGTHRRFRYRAVRNFSR